MDEESTTTPLLRHRLQWWRQIPSNAASSLRFHKTTIWSELGGSVGDLGTYIPIVLALTLVSKLDLGTTLIFTALYNIITGLLFGIPMPVQPMKSIASVAISEPPLLTLSQIAAAGIGTASVLLFLGATGLMSFLYRFIPLPVVRGVQLSQGLSFAFTAIKYVRYDQDFAANKQGGAREWIGLDGLIVALSAIVFLVITTGSGETYENGEQFAGKRRVRRRLQILSSIPSALIVFLIGIISMFHYRPHSFHQFTIRPLEVSRFENHVGRFQNRVYPGRGTANPPFDTELRDCGVQIIQRLVPGP
ncbi:hypothetical protein SSX86_025762 [Deinandra increscens subsp. villosa]|uniref:Sulfate transporter n=1 Tax=Deinandra increscens subsp. villosa TaxID=3103831 RepID=A0AAP0CJU3_9ASTR